MIASCFEVILGINAKFDKTLDDPLKVTKNLYVKFYFEIIPIGAHIVIIKKMLFV